MTGLDSIPVSAIVSGTRRLDIDGTSSIVSGTWSARRDGDRVELALVSTAPCRPGPLPHLMPENRPAGAITRRPDAQVLGVREAGWRP